jgi:putative PIN family toxin of toxin-antitoxin system
MPDRVVLDTNVLVAAAYAPASASRRIVEACIEGRLLAVASRAVKQEYELILARAVRVDEYRDRLAEFLDRLELAEPSQTPRLVVEDPGDDKFLAAAEAGRADWIVTNDRHLLSLDPHGAMRIVSSGRFVGLVPRC